jgi:hypothetical protein
VQKLQLLLRCGGRGGAGDEARNYEGSKNMKLALKQLGIKYRPSYVTDYFILGDEYKDWIRVSNLRGTWQRAIVPE